MHGGNKRRGPSPLSHIKEQCGTVVEVFHSGAKGPWFNTGRAQKFVFIDACSMTAFWLVSKPLSQSDQDNAWLFFTFHTGIIMGEQCTVNDLLKLNKEKYIKVNLLYLLSFHHVHTPQLTYYPQEKSTNTSNFTLVHYKNPYMASYQYTKE